MAKCFLFFQLSSGAFLIFSLHTLVLTSVFKLLSLYSTATQNTWHRGLALGNAPNARILHWRYQHVGIFWRYLTLKFALAPTQNLKLALAPMPTPDASQWNIGGVGPSDVGAGVGHVHFMFFVLISFAFCSQRKPSFQWNMGFTTLFLVLGTIFKSSYRYIYDPKSIYKINNSRLLK